MFEFIGGTDLKDDLRHAGIDPDPSTLTVSIGDRQVYGLPSEPRVVAFDDTTGQRSVGITQYDLPGYARRWVNHHVPALASLATTRGASSTYRGLLAAQKGVYAAVINEDGSVDPNKNQLVKVEIGPTPRAVNELQERFGRHPGRDAFTFTRLTGGHFTVGQYTEAFAGMKVPWADLEHWGIAYHDSEPGIHLNSLAETSPWGCRMVANRGQQLVSRYGSTIHAPKDKMPKHTREDLVRFCTGLEYLRLLSTPVSDTLLYLGHTASQDPTGFTISESELVQAVDEEITHAESTETCERLRSGWFFSPLGFVPGEDESDNKAESFATLLADRIGTFGELLLVLEDIRRPEEDTDEQLEARMRVWQTAANMAGRTALQNT